MRLGTRPIPSSGLALTVLGFGAAPLGGLYRSMSEAQADAAVAAALEGGIRYFDVAPLYGHGRAEHRVGRTLGSADAEVVLSTKVGRLLKRARPGSPVSSMFVDPLPFEIAFDYSYDGVMRSFEDSLQRLACARIDMLYIHDVNRHWHGDDVARRFHEVMEGGYRALVELRRAGDVRAIGVGVNDPEILVQFARAGAFDCFMLAGRYTLLDQSPLDTLLPLCVDKGIAIIAAAPFNSGILATGTTRGSKFFYRDAPQDIVERTRRIEGTCARHGVALPAAALQFPLGHPAVASVAAGVGSRNEVEANIAHMAAPIPEAFWEELKEAGLVRADCPVPVGAQNRSEPDGRRC